MAILGAAGTASVHGEIMAYFRHAVVAWSQVSSGLPRNGNHGLWNGVTWWMCIPAETADRKGVKTPYLPKMRCSVGLGTDARFLLCMYTEPTSGGTALRHACNLLGKLAANASQLAK